MVDDNSKCKHRIKFRWRHVPYIIGFVFVVAYLVVASYFIDAIIMTAYRFRPLNDTIQLTQNMFKPYVGAYLTQVLVSSQPGFMLFTTLLAIVLVYAEAAERLNQVWNHLTKPKENSELQIMPDTDNA